MDDSAPEDQPSPEAQEFRTLSARERRSESVGLVDDAELLTGEELETEIAEAEATHRTVPRVKPRKTEDLDIEPPSRQRYPVHIFGDLQELWRHRELGFTLVERDLRVRYKQAVLGGLWAVIQPIILMVLFTVVFSKVAKIVVPGVPYPAFSYTGLVAWGFFSGSIGYGTNAILTNAPIIRKIFCPRELFPITSVISSGFDYVISFVISLAFVLFYAFIATSSVSGQLDMRPAMTWLAFPLLLLTLVALMTAATLLVSALTVYFRDTRYAIPLLLQILLYATPIAYPMEKLVGGSVDGVVVKKVALHGWIAHAYPYLNPLAPVIDGFHRIFLYHEWPMWGPFLSASVVGFAGLVILYRWFKRIDRTFADVI